MDSDSSPMHINTYMTKKEGMTPHETFQQPPADKIFSPVLGPKTRYREKEEGNELASAAPSSQEHLDTVS